ncbi:MAG: class I SAM-dependent methyltransferase [Deltaproteobacteria bacterium]|nr:class I SAM-dependent methyltransferase [Deltaproteobacteria bacterium]
MIAMECFERLRQTINRLRLRRLCRIFEHHLHHLIHNAERILKPHVNPGMTVVDIGCGTGYFTLAMAKLVAPGGKVIAIDLHEEVLAALGRRACETILSDRIVLHHCWPDRIGMVKDPADFILVFWVACEVRDKVNFFGQVFDITKPGGRILLVEPKLRVTRRRFRKTVEMCQAAGFRLLGEPAVALSHAVRMEKSGSAWNPRRPVSFESAWGRDSDQQKTGL